MQERDRELLLENPIATALESYRREHGSYIESKSEATLIDHLNPRYLPRIIRVDPCHQPHEYEGPNTFILRSTSQSQYRER